MGIRNICLKNNACTLSMIITEILKDALQKIWKELVYSNKNTNIKNIEQWAGSIECESIDDNEEMICLDIKEMCNAIDTDILMDIIRKNIDSQNFNSKVIRDMIDYDWKL